MDNGHIVPLFYMKETTYETLAAFATEDRIIRILAKERGKFAIKRRGLKLPKGKGPKSFESNELFRKLQSLTPPHSLWTYHGRKQLPKAGDSIVSRWRHGKPVSFRKAIHKSKKVYDRKALKRQGPV